MRPLIESMVLEETTFEVDAEKAVVRGVTLIKPASKKGRTYSESFMRAHPESYNGLPVISPHLSEQFKSKAGLGDVVGQTANARFDESRGGVVADIESAPNDMGRTFMWAAGRKWKSIGISHEAVAWKATGDGEVIESWEPVRVAVVFDPATTTALDESAGPDKGGMTMDLPKLKAEHPALVESLKAEFAAEAASSGERAKLDAELKALRESKADLEKKLLAVETEKALAGKRAKAAEILESSQVLAKVRSDKALAAKHLAILESCKDEAEMKGYVETLEKSVAALGGATFSESKRVVGAGSGEISESEVDEAVEAVRGR